MRRLLHRLATLCLIVAGPYADAGELLGGVTRVSITPATPMFMSGYAGREKTSAGIAHPIHAKALVLREDAAHQVVIVTTDLLGIPHHLSEAVARRVMEKHGIDRSQLMLNASHTHAGPMVWPSLSIIAEYGGDDQKLVVNYGLQLADRIIEAVDAAFAALQPVRLHVAFDSAGFAFNRRLPTPKGFINSQNPAGPVDRQVPVLRMEALDGRTLALLFGYACHNTTLGADNYQIGGDYAGFAQSYVEEALPGSTALFMTGCGGDQNPYPRGTPELARQHGRELADAVMRAVKRPMKPVGGQVRTARETTELTVSPYSTERYLSDLTGENKYLQRRARLYMEAYNKGWDIDSYRYPVQAIRLGRELTILALAGEVVVDYALRAKREFPDAGLFVAGYSGEVMCYIPSRRVLLEGGYEAEDSMIYYGMPGPFDERVEERVFEAVRKVMRRVRR
jgi:neutral ceramidase